MAHLEKTIQEKIDTLKNMSGQAYSKGDIHKGINFLISAWEEFPTPKEKYDESYHIALYIIKMALKIKDYELAKRWVDILQHCDPERPEIGEREFVAGQVAYDAGEMDRAKQLFKIADKKSNGLCFQGEDKKYKKLIK